MADDFSGVPFDGDRVTPELVKKQYDEAVAGLGDVKPHVTIATPHGRERRRVGDAHWSWPIGDGWSYSSKIPLVTHDQGDTWAVPWKVGIIHPSLAAGDTLDATTVGATRGDILGADGLALVTDRPVVRIGIDRTKVGAAQAGDSARGLAQLVGVDPAPYAKQVKAAGDWRSSRRSSSAGTRCRAAVLSGSTTTSRAPRDHRRAAARRRPRSSPRRSSARSAR